jgi:hypothetical protein
MLSHVSGSGGPDAGCIAFLLISGPMSTTTSFRTASARWAVKYMPLRPPMDSPTSTSGARPSWSTTPVMSPNAATGP